MMKWIEELKTKIKFSCFPPPQHGHLSSQCVPCVQSFTVTNGNPVLFHNADLLGNLRKTKNYTALRVI